MIVVTSSPRYLKSNQALDSLAAESRLSLQDFCVFFPLAGFDLCPWTVMRARGEKVKRVQILVAAVTRTMSWLCVRPPDGTAAQGAASLHFTSLLSG